MCKRRFGHARAFYNTLELIQDLDKFHKELIIERYLHLCADFENRCYFFSIIFHLCRTLVTVGSLIVPALLSIQYTDTSSSPNTMSPENFSYQIYWATWVISLLVTTSNGVFTLFKVEKKYYSLNTTLEQLRSEGWQYLQLSGRYSGFYYDGKEKPEKPTHLNQFLFFCHVIEKIKMKQVQDEYYKLSENQTNPSTSNSTQQHTTTHEENTVIPIPNTKQQHLPTFLTDSIIPPTPLHKNIQQLLQALTVDGGSSSKTASQEGTTEVPVRSEVSTKSVAKESILRSAPGIMSEEEPPNRLGAKVSTESVEQRPASSENA